MTLTLQDSKEALEKNTQKMLDDDHELLSKERDNKEWLRGLELFREQHTDLHLNLEWLSPPRLDYNGEVLNSIGDALFSPTTWVDPVCLPLTGESGSNVMPPNKVKRLEYYSGNTTAENSACSTPTAKTSAKLRRISKRLDTSHTSHSASDSEDEKEHQKKSNSHYFIRPQKIQKSFIKPLNNGLVDKHSALESKVVSSDRDDPQQTPKSSLVASEQKIIQNNDRNDNLSSDSDNDWDEDSKDASNVLKNNKRPRRKASEAARNVLMDWIVRNENDPYPTRPQKKELAIASGLTEKQIVHWMSNIRKRRLLPLMCGRRCPMTSVDYKFLEEIKNRKQILEKHA